MSDTQRSHGNVIEGGLEALMRRAGSHKGPPPVETWNPPFCGDIDMRIAADGTWFYMGTPIGREALVRLFASVLRRDEDGRTYLVTPVERCGITVDDAPFVAVEMQAVGEGEARRLVFRTNVGDVVEAGPAHPLRFEIVPGNDGLKPYLHVRGRLEARLARPVMYELVAEGVERDIDGRPWFGVWSDGTFFPIVPAEDARFD
ncbi:DUF1285 domain-containing protein [Prosthecomicrobium sp. N25]|uniref:DUF1285 domain-containing protein n=1 Tax=Prosthecomicrobium sp. N25 TaxID=3129254 RepID=UPI003077B2A6